MTQPSQAAERSLQTQVDDALARVEIAIGNFPVTGEPLDVTAADFDRYSRTRNFGSIGYYALTDGTALFYTSKHPLAFRSHRFIIPFYDDPEYFSYAYDVDGQCVSPPVVNLIGRNAIANDINATEQLLFLADNASLAKAYKKSDKYRMGQMRRRTKDDTISI